MSMASITAATRTQKKPKAPVAARRTNSQDSKNKKRSTLDHFAESFKIAKKKIKQKRLESTITPWLVPAQYRVVKPEENFDHTYSLTTMSRIFVTFEEASSSKLSYMINIVIMLVLIISCVQYVVVTLPSVQYKPESCSYPVCEDDPILCPARVICEPIAPAFFQLLETACVAVFTVDYAVRVMTCAHTPARLCGVIPLSLYMSEEEPLPGDMEHDILERYLDPDYEELWYVPKNTSKINSKLNLYVLTN
jgi:hypothetical protein